MADERRDPPDQCHGCGLSAAVDAEEPAPHETTFEVEEVTEDAIVWRCGTCGTMHRIPKDPEPTVPCRNCGQEIPESLQGNHVCETHPLGLAAEPPQENPMEEHR